jgi:ribosomal protein L40E
MKVCRHCGSLEQDDAYRCSLCQRALPLRMPSELSVRKAGLTVLIPALVWIVMTRLLQS